ncbi:hypothetical protein BDF20DRAFT_964238 [Mycotypha africana]|uniref:uncharacterized protein n=1 Tax=Mycotypha africana TaxID=64632 RepID=UPI0023009DCA|nr:uncharacterized protein BDF20DRAFT_964238 [Mycotypha africana]KAI8968261.1 hypothetical protein BDF20DRAFT_964238 [Mycotypha africana]
MPNRRRSSVSNGTRAPAKLFKCTGFGNCNMVFTRSEHLARHQRKHTGEKPYKCIVPGCERMFSRFDNMMQHTQTHDKNKKLKAHSHSQKFSQNNGLKEQQQRHSTGSYSMSNSRNSQFLSPSSIMTNSVPSRAERPRSMIDSKILPLPNTSRALMPTESSFPHVLYQEHSSYSAIKQPSNRFSWPLRRDAHPYPQHQPNTGPYLDPYSHISQHPPSYCHPSSSSTSHPLNDLHARRLSSASTNSSESTLPSPISSTSLPPPKDVGTQTARRRISIDDLRLPIESIKNIHLSETTDPNAHSLNKSHQYEHLINSHNTKSTNNNNQNQQQTVDITTDELEALEGFGKFHSTSVIASNNPELSPSPVLHTDSPNIASQVCAMRQRVMSLNESFQRR